MSNTGVLNKKTYDSVKLGEVLISAKGKKPKLVASEPSDGWLPYINIKAFEQHVFDEYTDGENCLPCEDGDLLMVWDGSRSGMVGKAHKGYVGSTLAKISVPGVTNEFLYYFLQGKYRILNSKVKGTGTPHVNPEILGNFDFPIIPMEEQLRIVAKIEELFSELDKGVESLQKVKMQLKLYRQAVLKDVFEGRYLDQNFGRSVLRQPLETIMDNIRIGPFGTMLHKSDYICGGIPVINPKHIKDQSIKPDLKVTVSVQKAEELNSYKLKENDILLGRRGEMGRSSPVTESNAGWICGTGSMILRLKKEYMAKFYSLILSSQDVVHYLEGNCTGTTMKNLNEKTVKKIPVPIFTIFEQECLIYEIESRLSVCDKIEQIVDESLLKAESLRQSILKKAFEGKLVPYEEAING